MKVTYENAARYVMTCCINTVLTYTRSILTGLIPRELEGAVNDYMHTFSEKTLVKKVIVQKLAKCERSIISTRRIIRVIRVIRVIYLALGS